MDFKAQRLGLGASSFSLSPFAAGTRARKNLGQTEQLLYSRAKTAITEFDLLFDNMPRASRDKLAELVSKAESTNPADYAVFSGAQKDVEELENQNRAGKARLEAMDMADTDVTASAAASDDGRRGWMMPLGVLVITGALIWYKVSEK